MKTEIKIVKLFIENKGHKTIREIAKQICADYKITYIATQRLIEQNVLSTETVGKSTLCTLNSSYYGIEIYQTENERKESILNNKTVNLLYKEIMLKTNTCSFILLLFGSYAKGRQTKS